MLVVAGSCLGVAECRVV